MSESSMLVLLAAALPCWIEGYTHLAWIRSESAGSGVRHLEVERWVHGQPPLPSQIQLPWLDTVPPPPPPDTHHYLAALRRDATGWVEGARLDGETAQTVVDFAAKRSVAQTVAGGTIHFDRAPASFPAVTIAVWSGGRPVRQFAVTRPDFEILGLPHGTYSLTAAAQGYRQRHEMRFSIHTCAAIDISMTRYGIAEWVEEKVAPAVSMMKAAWMLAREYTGLDAKP